jgi:membrane dipeptidase
MAYDYLGQNVIPVKLCKEIDRIGERVVKLSQKDEERAMRLHRESIVIDFHLHDTIMPEDLKDFETLARSGRPAVGYEGIKKSGLTGFLRGFGGSMGRRSSPAPWQLNDIIWDLGIRQADLDHHPEVGIRGFSAKDIRKAKETGRTAMIPHVENAQIIDNDIDRVDMLYGLGLRCLGLSYNSRTTVADGCTERTDGGLSSFGFKVIERMNRLGMLIDLSHSSDIAAKETIEASKVPCALTHTFARGLFNSPRGRSDDLLKLLAERGGVIGVAAVANLMSGKEVQTVFDVIDQVDYLVKLVGVDHVAIGTDAMFGDHVGMHKLMRGVMDMMKALRELPAPYVEYIENPGEWPNLTRALVARGYPDEAVKKIIGENVLKFLERTIG